MSKFVEGVLTTLLIPFIMALCLLIDGWAIWLLWAWYAEPLGVVGITLPWAIGIGLLSGSLTARYSPVPKEQKHEQLSIWTHIIFRPGLVVLIGWILRIWM